MSIKAGDQVRCVLCHETGTVTQEAVDHWDHRQQPICTHCAINVACSMIKLVTEKDELADGFSVMAHRKLCRDGSSTISELIDRLFS